MIEQLQELMGAVEVWQASDGPYVLWRGRQTAALDQNVVDRIDDLAEALVSIDFDRDVWHTVLACDKFLEAYQTWKRDLELPDSPADPGGGRDLWDRYAVLLQELAPRVMHQFEGVPHLFKQKISHNQIAKMAGWFTPTGSPDIRKVMEEMANPGTHYDPKTWISPDDKQREDELERAWAARCAKMRAKIEELEQTRQAEAARLEDGPEELDDLVTLPGVTISNIKKMKPKATIEEIEAACARQGMRLNATPGAPLGRTVGKLARQRERREAFEQEIEQRQDAVESPILAEEEVLEQRILTMRQSGLRPGQISDVLAKEGIEISAQRVGKMLSTEAAPK